MLTRFFIATPAEASEYNPDAPSPEAENALFEGLSRAALGELFALLQGTEHACAIDEHGIPQIEHLSPELVSLLTEMDETDIEHAAAEWTQTSELLCTTAAPCHVAPIIEAAVRLARQAQQSGKRVYVSTCA